MLTEAGPRRAKSRRSETPRTTSRSVRLGPARCPSVFAICRSGHGRSNSTWRKPSPTRNTIYANGILAILGFQLLVTDAVFVAFAWAGEGWSLSPGVIEVWLGATVVQVVGIVLIVTRHLFPSRDGRPATG
jgi:hypothetical protein